MLRRLILSALLGAALGAAAWSLGMDAAHAVGLGAAAFAFTACLSSLGDVADVVWAVSVPPPRAGARRDVVQLGWSLGARGGRSSPEGVRRLRVIAERTLRLRGLELEDRDADDRLIELLGADALRVLRRGSGVAPPSTAAITAVLARLETLTEADAAQTSGTGMRTAPAVPTSAAASSPAQAASVAATSPVPPTPAASPTRRTVSTSSTQGTESASPTPPTEEHPHAR